MDRIPLSVIEEAFFANEHVVYKSEAVVENDMNDYTVIRLGDKPVPEPLPVAKYPKFTRVPIKSEIPSVFYSIKVRPEPVPEYVPPPPPHPREVNIENLSKSQAAMYGKSPFQQDLILIKRKKEIIAKNGPAPDPNTIPPREGVKVPEMYVKFAKEHEREVAEKKKEMALKDKKERKEQMKKKQEDQAYQKRMKEVIELRKMEKELEQEKAEAERREIEKEKEKRRKEIAANWNPARPTRASQLKDDSCRRGIESQDLEEKRLKLSRELRREKDKKEMIKLKPVLERLKPLDAGNGRAEKMRKKMRDDQRKWVRWLKLTEAENDQKQPMLERLFADDHIAEMGDSGDHVVGGKMDANMVEYE